MGDIPQVPTAKFSAYQQKQLQKQQSADKSEAKRATFELDLMKGSRFIEVNGLVHHYHDSGPKDAKETVLLIHGWDCWWMWWYHQIEDLNEQGIRTIAYDMKGHGWSANDPDNNYHIDSFAKDLNGLVTGLGLKNFHIAAFSFGPFVALDYVHRFPNTVRSMVFFNFGFLPNSEFISGVACNTITFMFNNLLRRLTWWLPAYMFARLVLAKNTVMQHDIMIGFESLGLCASEAIEQTTRQITSFEITNSVPDMVKSVSVPILFVAGEGDAIMTSENTKKLQEMTHKGEFISVPDCGHLITFELPETASELILQQVGNHS
jgi:pimeloyl-ACP methyl ester carboxylesterase